MGLAGPHQVLVSVDIGSQRHRVAIGLPDGEVLEEFEIAHNPEGFRDFFFRINRHEKKYGSRVAVAMEGYNGYARPLDSLVRARDYRLYNINNLKLARFKEIFPSAAKTDQIDARKGLELFLLRDRLPMAKDVLQEVASIPEENEILKRLSRRRSRLVSEKVRVLNNMQADLQAVCPGLLEITGNAGNLWFLRFLTCADDLRKLSRMRLARIQKIPGVGKKYAGLIAGWQKRAHFSDEVDWVGEMIQEDAARALELIGKIDAIEDKCEEVAMRSHIARTLTSIPGFGPVCTSVLAGEIGTIERFRGESSLALYVGMANLNNSSGKYKGSKSPKHVNTRAKAAMMNAVDKHRKVVPGSQRYYLKKRAEGKNHNQAIRSLGRHLCRVMFKIIKEGTLYKYQN